MLYSRKKKILFGQEDVKIYKSGHTLEVMVQGSGLGASSLVSTHATHVAGTESELVKWREQFAGAVHKMRRRVEAILSLLHDERIQTS